MELLGFELPWWTAVVAGLVGVFLVLPELHLRLEGWAAMRRRNQYDPENEVNPITVTKIVVYPLKSGRGCEVASCALTERGLRFDRQWMVVDESGTFMSQRRLPKLALVECGLPTSPSQPLRLDAPGMPTLEVPVLERGWLSGPPLEQCRVWDDQVLAVDQGDAAARWFSEFLGEPNLRLVRHADRTVRPTDPEFAKGFQTSLADGFPLLIASEESVEDLNMRLGVGNGVKMDRFRPNVIVRGAGPFGEDAWRTALVGDRQLRLDVVKPCARCKMPTNNQATGVMDDAHGQPIATLKTYRTGKHLKLPKPEWRDEVFFGQNAVSVSSGTLRVGDTVRVVRKQAWAMAY